MDDPYVLFCISSVSSFCGWSITGFLYRSNIVFWGSFRTTKQFAGTFKMLTAIRYLDLIKITEIVII
jgi:hypothetical protein